MNHQFKSVNGDLHTINKIVVMTNGKLTEEHIKDLPEGVEIIYLPEKLQSIWNNIQVTTHFIKAPICTGQIMEFLREQGECHVIIDGERSAVINIRMNLPQDVTLMISVLGRCSEGFIHIGWRILPALTEQRAHLIMEIAGNMKPLGQIINYLRLIHKYQP